MLLGLSRLLGFGTATPSPRRPLARPVSMDFGSIRVSGPHQRRPERPEDHALGMLAIEWLKALPRRHRPEALALRFPRICNRFALLWPDPALTEAYFESLLVDRRGDRRGFPREVLTDLLRLNEYFVQQQSGGAYRSLIDGVCSDRWADRGRV